MFDSAPESFKRSVSRSGDWKNWCIVQIFSFVDNIL